MKALFLVIVSGNSVNKPDTTSSDEFSNLLVFPTLFYLGKMFEFFHPPKVTLKKVYLFQNNLIRHQVMLMKNMSDR